MKEKAKIYLKSKPFLYNIYLTLFYYPEYLYYRYLVKKRVKSFRLNKNCSFVKLPVKTNSFFGYYNISPFNNGNDLIWCETPESRTRGGMHSPVDIIHYNAISKKKRSFSQNNSMELAARVYAAMAWRLRS